MQRAGGWQRQRPRRAGLALMGPTAAMALTGLAITVACAPAVEPILGCEAGDGPLEVVCGFQNPEDLVPLPESGALLVSEFGSIEGDRPGWISLFDPASGRHERLFPAPAGAAAAHAESAPGWGDPACPGPPGDEFSPHGIDLGTGPDESLALLVVNHGGREAIEWFEVRREETEPGWSVAWRGCTVAPAGSFLNDVAILPGTGFLATHMMERARSRWSLLWAAWWGSPTGYVLEWQPGSQTDAGWRRLPGSEATLPNGIAVSPSGETVYLNAYLGDELRAFERSSGEPAFSVAVSKPDNVTWSRDGRRLLIASHDNASLAAVQACGHLKTGSCPLAFAVVAVDAATGASEVLFEHAGPPMGAATVALESEQGIWLGTYAGDRLGLLRSLD